MLSLLAVIVDCELMLLAGKFLEASQGGRVASV